MRFCKSILVTTFRSPLLFVKYGTVVVGNRNMNQMCSLRPPESYNLMAETTGRTQVTLNNQRL